MAKEVPFPCMVRLHPTPTAAGVRPAERVWALRNVGATLALGGPGEQARARQMLEKAALLKAQWVGGERHPGAPRLSDCACTQTVIYKDKAWLFGLDFA